MSRFPEFIAVHLHLLRDVRLIAGMAALALSFSGCHEEPMGGPRVEIVPIIGKVLVDDKPQENITVNFLRVSPREADFPFPDPRGMSDKDGNFVITSYETGDGGAPGDYKLTFEWGVPNPFTGEIAGDKFRGKYAVLADSQFPVTVPAEVGDKPFDIGTIELTTK